MRTFLRARWLAAVVLLAAGAAAGRAQEQPAATPGKPTAAELEMGKQAAAQIEKEFKLVDDPATLARLGAIIARLRPYTERPGIEYHASPQPGVQPEAPLSDIMYQAKIVEDSGINAFSLPGGYIYITKPLLAAVESEDELAAVIAHEMAHVSLAHGLDLAAREAKINNKAALAVLAAVLAGKNVDAGNVVVLASLVRSGLLSGYSQEAERQADSHAVVYLQRAGYHPVAMLTVVEGLARMEMQRPSVELGIFKTHPYPAERARATRQQFAAMGIPINPRPVLGTLKASSQSVEQSGRTIGRVTIDDSVIFEPAVPANGLTPPQRAEKAALDLGRLLLDNLAMHGLRTVVTADQATVLARGKPLVTILPGDAEFHGATLAELAAKTEAAIKLALWQETVRRAV